MRTKFNQIFAFKHFPLSLLRMIFGDQRKGNFFKKKHFFINKLAFCSTHFIITHICLVRGQPSQWASQVVLVVKKPPANAGDMRRSFDPWVRKIPWRRVWQSTSVFLFGGAHGQRSLAGYGAQHRVGHDRCNLACMHACSHLSGRKDK